MSPKGGSGGGRGRPGSGGGRSGGGSGGARGPGRPAGGGRPPGEGGGRPASGGRPGSGRPAGGRPSSGRPSGRPAEGRPGSEQSGGGRPGAGRPTSAGRPGGGRPAGAGNRSEQADAAAPRAYADIIYGRNAVQEAMRARLRTVRSIWATETTAREPWLRGVDVKVANPHEIADRCGSDGHQGVCAMAGRFPYADATALLRRPAAAPRRARRGPGRPEPRRHRQDGGVRGCRWAHHPRAAVG